MPAEHIAAVLQVPEVDVYTELVRAYDKGIVRINPGREWEAMDELSA
jgi:DNA-binding transcriptional regulator LsrR (DeoR family)